MNFKSKILKLSIIFILVLVLIPVASAMDSDEGFYLEYDTGSDFEYQDYEGVVEEYNDWQVVDTQEEVSSPSDYEGYEDFEDKSVLDQQSRPVYDDEDAIDLAEFEVNSVVETHDIIVNEDASVQFEYEIPSQNVADAIVYNINETSEDGFTFKSIVNQGSIFISKHHSVVNYVIINHIVLCTETLDTDFTSLNRNIDKVLELKNNLILKQDMQTSCSSNKINDLEDIIVCMNHINTDFAYSIDNSVVGDHDGIYLINRSCFYNFSPCFAATFCDFKIFEYFFCGDIISSGFFCNIAVENCLGNIDVEYSQKNLMFSRFFSINLTPIRGLSDNYCKISIIY